MKNLSNKILILLFTLMVISCGEEDFPVPEASTVDANFEFTVSNDGFAPATVDFKNLSAVESGYSPVYSWNFGDGASSTDENPSHTYSEPGTYTISMSISTDNDLDFMEKTLTIKDPDALQVRLFLIDAGSMTINEVNGSAFDVDGFGTGIEYDPINEQIYYTDADNGTLMRVSLNGDNKEMISDVFSDPRDVALDIENDKAYVTDRGAGVNAVYEVDLTNNSASVLIDEAGGLGTLPVGIDYYNDELYITCVDIGAEAVWKIGTNGIGLKRIIDYGDGGYGYGIAVDKANERIYFDNTDSNQILSAKLDGSDISSVATTGNRAYGLVIDNGNNKLYWSERNSGSVFMSDLDGSNKVTLSSDFNDPRGIFFIP